MKKIIISTQGDSARQCLDEIKETYKKFTLIKWLDSEKGIGLAEIEDDFEIFSEIIKNSKPIYLRHIFEVQDEISLGDIDDFKKLINSYGDKMDLTSTYAIQGFVITGEVGKKELNELIMEELANKGFACNNQYPKQVISYVVLNDKIYLGLGNPKLNLSDWTLGMRRYQKYENQISRAEFKLLEAIETFEIDLSNYKNALDLGAAPGGWTKVLLEKDLEVTAVDPAKLEIKSEKLTHYKGLAEEFIKSSIGKQKFDVIVNDMKMDVLNSAEIMVEMANKLNKDGIIIMTYKLPKNKSKGKILDGNRILLEKYEILGIKQLFHNRNEVTVILKNK